MKDGNGDGNGRPSRRPARRNVGLMAHIDAGKTTVTERMLYDAGRIRKTGEVHDGQATMDFMEEERRRGITIQSAATSLTWGGAEVTILDTPGHVDFTAEVERSLRVLDGAVAVFCAVAGVQAQSETVWRQADRYRVPRISFVNKMDRTGADLSRVIGMISEHLGARPLPLQLPLGEESAFHGVLDLVEERAILFEARGDGRTWRVAPVPEDQRERLAEARHDLIDRVTHFSDEVLELYLADEPIPATTMKAAIREATLSGKATPVLCGTALRNKGVQLLMDAIVDYLPGPADLPAVRGVDPRLGDPVKRSPSDEEPVAALAFKTVADPNGDLTYLRVYSGTVVRGQALLNPRTGKRVRIGRLLRMHARHREPLEEARAGDIVAALGLRDTATADTLCDEGSPVILGAMRFPEAVISMSIAPRGRSDRDRLADALSRLSREDPTFRFRTDEETGELVIAGMGELHLDVIRARLLGDFGVPTLAGPPRVAYRQTLRRAVEVEGRHVKQTGGRGQFGVVRVRFESGGGGSTVLFESEVVGGAIPREYHRSVRRGIEDVAVEGGDLRFPLVNVHAVLVDGRYHEVDSSEMAFREAGRIAMREAMRKAGTILLEPRVRFQVQVPEDFLGDVLADLDSRRAEVEHLSGDGPAKEIEGLVPVAELFSYSTTLRSLTHGRGTFHTEPADYHRVPDSIAEEVTRAATKRKAAPVT